MSRDSVVGALRARRPEVGREQSRLTQSIGDRELQPFVGIDAEESDVGKASRSARGRE
jgi:hypothetical protein